MRTATTEYTNFMVRIPRGADAQPLKALVEAMGWNIVVPSIAMELPAVTHHATDRPAKPSQRLRGIFRKANTDDFDYKRELYKSLKEKYEQ